MDGGRVEAAVGALPGVGKQGGDVSMGANSPMFPSSISGTLYYTSVPFFHQMMQEAWILLYVAILSFLATKNPTSACAGVELMLANRIQ